MLLPWPVFQDPDKQFSQNTVVVIFDQTKYVNLFSFTKLGNLIFFYKIHVVGSGRFGKLDPTSKRKVRIRCTASYNIIYILGIQFIQ